MLQPSEGQPEPASDQDRKSAEDLARETQHNERLRIVADHEDDPLFLGTTRNATYDGAQDIASIMRRQRPPAGVIVLQNTVVNITGGTRDTTHLLLGYHFYEKSIPNVPRASERALGLFAMHAESLLQSLPERSRLRPAQEGLLQRTVFGAKDKDWPQPFAVVLDELMDGRSDADRQVVVNALRAALDTLAAERRHRR